MAALAQFTGRTCTAIFFVYCCLQFGAEARSFTVDYDKHIFLKDGQPYNYVSGSIHYARVPFYYWQDRLKKMHAAGLDAVQVYVPWNVHEVSPGVYDFSGQQDISNFLKLAQSTGLLVILRAGPYICGEWEYGGFPAWLLKNNGSVVVRTMDPGYIKPVDRWLSVLLPVIKPLIYANGGPVIMVQVENEYGSYFACDHDYISHLAQTFRQGLGDNVVLFTTDGSGTNYLKCGAHPDLLTTVDFGPGNATAGFQPLIDWGQGGPMINSEYYTGWLDYWGTPHSQRDTASIVSTLKDMLDMKASVNMYMFEGGTNFGFMNGADPTFNVCPTSYDYDAPLSEAGDTTPKYTAIRSLISKYKPVPSEVPPNTPKLNLGKVKLSLVGTVYDLLEQISLQPPVKSQYPLTMEQVDQGYGFILYRHQMAGPQTVGNLQIPGIRDAGYVLLDGVSRGFVDRNVVTGLSLVARKGQNMDILVENQGRVNFGTDILNNTKGINTNVTLNGKVLQLWEIYPLNLTHLAHMIDSGQIPPSNIPKRFANVSSSIATPSAYAGKFTLPLGATMGDTFLNMQGWFKGQVYINGFNLGRYWPVRGPQVTLYVPGGILRPHPQSNSLMMLELQWAPCPDACTITLTDVPKINGSVTAL